MSRRHLLELGARLLAVRVRGAWEARRRILVPFTLRFCGATENIPLGVNEFLPRYPLGLVLGSTSASWGRKDLFSIKCVGGIGPQFRLGNSGGRFNHVCKSRLNP